MHGFLYLTQTNFHKLSLATLSLFDFIKQKRINTPFFYLLLTTLIISGCSTKPTTKVTRSSSQTETSNISSIVTAEEKLALANSLNASTPIDANALILQQAKVNNLLVEACELFLHQNNFQKALWLADKTAELGHNNPLNSYKLLLVKANSLFALGFYEQAEHQLALANDLVTYTSNYNPEELLELTDDYYLISTKVLEAQGKTVLALSAKLNAFALSNTSANSDIQLIWNKLEKLTQWQLAQLISLNPPFIKGWVKLLNFSHKFGDNIEQFSRYLSVWQQQHSTHPAIEIIEQLKLNNAVKVDPKNIAILLPLSGSQLKAGLAAQQGILAAYNNAPESHLNFIDTNKVDWSSLAEHLTTLNIDHIIGPLLKPNVELFLDASAEHQALQIPTLLLNVPSSKQILSNNQAALSMRPEDEAVQAATTLSQHNYHQPIILSHQDRVSKRIAIAFRQQWLKSTGNEVDIVYFNQGKEMQASLKQSLDVTASQTRIKQLNSRLKHNIKSEPRNRRDIDMIYLVGSAAQTRLIKPYIDVNISPFADIIPVYASSRSHSNFSDKNHTSSTNDLKGLIFTQIPWLLESKQRNKQLNALSNKLWPKRTDSLSKIFAMGFDSFNLLGKLSLMKQASYIRHFGQTGVLKLNNSNIITRSLIWGEYKNDMVMQISMDKNANKSQ
mgnify:FL=1